MSGLRRYGGRREVRVPDVISPPRVHKSSALDTVLGTAILARRPLACHLRQARVTSDLADVSRGRRMLRLVEIPGQLKVEPKLGLHTK